MPKVSVIIPIFQAEAYIERCVRSLFCQTLDGVEYIFIDDCSPDQSMKILDMLIEEYHERIVEMSWVIRIEKMPINRGQAAVRRYGMQLATGDYVIQCDSDDWVEESMLNEMWNKASKEGLGVVICDFYHDRANKSKYHKGIRSSDPDEIFYDVLSSKSWWNLWNKMFHRKTFEENDIIYPQKGMNMGEDMLLTVQMLFYCMNNGKIGYVNKAFYHYCDNQNSITHQFSADQVLRNTLQWRKNIYSLERFINRNNPSKRAKDIVLWLKYSAKRRISPFIEEKKYALVWRMLFKEINFIILFCPMLPRRRKWTYCKTYIKTLYIIYRNTN